MKQDMGLYPLGEFTSSERSPLLPPPSSNKQPLQLEARYPERLLGVGVDVEVKGEVLAPAHQRVEAKYFRAIIQNQRIQLSVSVFPFQSV